MSTEKVDDLPAINNYTIFFLGLSFRWGSLERMILKDCLLARDAGAKVYLYCYKNSLLEERAMAEGITTIHHHGKVHTKIFQWNKLKVLTRLFRELNVNLVHCYDIKILWPISFFLRANPLVPLVFTQGFELRKFYRAFWFKPLVSRVDQVFLPTIGLEENVWGHLGIPPRKVDLIGMACPAGEHRECPKPPFRYTEERWYIGTNLTGLETNTKFLNTIFHAFQVLLQNKLEEKGFTLVLALERPWSEFGLNDELKRQVKDMGIEEYVAFVGPVSMEEIQRHVDVWVGQSRREDLEDYTVESLLNGRPVVMPRSVASMETLRELGRVGETYKRDDSRELREKITKILLNLETYEGNLHKANQPLRDRYGDRTYAENLIKIYYNLLNRRKRLLRRRLHNKDVEKNP